MREALTTTNASLLATIQAGASLFIVENSNMSLAKRALLLRNQQTIVVYTASVLKRVLTITRAAWSICLCSLHYTRIGYRVPSHIGYYAATITSCASQ